MEKLKCVMDLYSKIEALPLEGWETITENLYSSKYPGSISLGAFYNVLDYKVLYKGCNIRIFNRWRFDDACITIDGELLLSGETVTKHLEKIYYSKLEMKRIEKGERFKKLNEIF